MSDQNKKVVTSGQRLTDVHINVFNNILRNIRYCSPRGFSRLRHHDETIEPVSCHEKHIEILDVSENQNGHWVCSFYDGNKVFIYDSLNSKLLNENCNVFLKKLYPFYDFKNLKVTFSQVQHQSNIIDCGIFAIAYAVSLVYNCNPETIRYYKPAMRLHLLSIFNAKSLQLFPSITCKNKSKALQMRQYKTERDNAKVQLRSQTKDFGRQFSVASILPFEASKMRKYHAKEVCKLRQNETEEHRLIRQKKMHNLSLRNDAYKKFVLYLFKIEEFLFPGNG